MALFQAIKTGQSADYRSLRAVAIGLAEAEAQIALFDETEAPAASPNDAERASRFQRKIETVV